MNIKCLICKFIEKLDFHEVERTIRYNQYNRGDSDDGGYQDFVGTLDDLEEGSSITITVTNTTYLNRWFGGLDFRSMERIIGYRQDDFSDEDGFQEFVDACEEWWNRLSIEGKKDVYYEYCLR